MDGNSRRNNNANNRFGAGNMNGRASNFNRQNSRAVGAAGWRGGADGGNSERQNSRFPAGNNRAAASNRQHLDDGRSWRAEDPNQGALEQVARDPLSGEGKRFYITKDKIYGGGGPLPANRGNGVPYQIHRTTGLGTLQNPEIVWLVRPVELNFTRERETMKQAALDVGVKCIVVRTPPHNQMQVRDVTGAPIIITMNGGQTAQRTERSEWHYTVWLGESRQKLQLQGHLFVYGPDDTRGTPLTLIRNPSHRRDVRSNRPCDADYYEYWGALKADIRAKPAAATTGSTATTSKITNMFSALAIDEE